MGKDNIKSVLILFLATVAVVRGVNCPHSFVKLYDQCYFFSESLSLRKTWDDARDYCRGYSNDGTYYDLLTLDDTFDEYITIKTFLEMKNYVSTTFIGARVLSFDRNQWMWVDGRNLPLNLPLWNCNYPSSYDCASMLFIYEFVGNTFYDTRRHKLQDARCDLPQFFICEGFTFSFN